MSAWAFIKFYYQTMLGSAGSILTASSTATGDYQANYLFNMLETNRWMAGSTAPPQTVTYDAGAGNTKTADYIAVIGHNLATAGASIYLEYSDDNVNWTESWSTTPTVDTVLLAEFASRGAHRYWRVRLFKSPTGFNAAPYMSLCIWGNRTELDYADTDYDPYEQEDKSNVLVSPTGYLLGIYGRYIERSLRISFQEADSTLYGKIKSWWEASRLKNFFVAWEIANNPADVFLMHPDPKFSNPLTNGGAYRNITISLKGRKE